MKDPYDYERAYPRTIDGTTTIDEGLRAYFIQIYRYMGLGLALTAFVAVTLTAFPNLMITLFTTPLRWVVVFAPVAMVFFLSARVHRLSLPTAQLMFWAYSALMGVSLSSIFLVFRLGSIAHVFFISASIFGAMSLYGYTTKRDLSSIGSFLLMGVWGVFMAAVVNLFLGHSTLQLVISVLAVFIFTGLTAYDMQTLKALYYGPDSAEVQGKKAIMGALNLYLDFINIFVSLLRIFGEERR